MVYLITWLSCFLYVESIYDWSKIWSSWFNVFFLFCFFFKSNLFKRQWSYFTLDDVSVIQSKSVKNMHFKNLFFFWIGNTERSCEQEKIVLDEYIFLWKYFACLNLRSMFYTIISSFFTSIQLQKTPQWNVAKLFRWNNYNESFLLYKHFFITSF